MAIALIRPIEISPFQTAGSLARRAVRFMKCGDSVVHGLAIAKDTVAST